MAVVFHFQNHKAVFLPGPYGQLSSAPRGQIMLYGIFHNRLQNQPGNLGIQHVFIDFPCNGEALSEAFPDDIQIGIHIGQFLAQRDTAAAVSAERAVHHDGKCFQHGACPGIVSKAGFPVDNFKGVVQKMRVDLQLQCFHLSLLQCLLFLNGAVELIFQLCRHFIEVFKEPVKLPAVSGRLYLITAFSRLQMVACVHQDLHRFCDLPPEQIQHHGQQRKDQQQHKQCCCLNLRDISPEMERGERSLNTDGVSGNLLFINMVGRNLTVFSRLQKPVFPVKELSVQNQPGTADLLHGINRLEQHAVITQEHHACIRPEMAVDEVPCHVKLPAVFQKEYAGVEIFHFIQEVCFHFLPVNALCTVAEIAPAGGIRADIIIPETEKNSKHPLIAGEIRVQIVCNGAVQRSAVSVQLIEAVGVPDNAVIRNRLGSVKYGIHPDSQLFNGILRAAVQLLAGSLLIAPAEQISRKQRHAENRQHPAQQHQGQQVCAQGDRFLFFHVLKSS